MITEDGRVITAGEKEVAAELEKMEVEDKAGEAEKPDTKPAETKKAGDPRVVVILRPENPHAEGSHRARRHALLFASRTVVDEFVVAVVAAGERPARARRYRAQAVASGRVRLDPPAT